MENTMQLPMSDSFFFLAGGNDDVGFATIRQGDAIDSASCNNTYNTIISWKCEPATTWDHSKTNVTLLAEFNIGSCIVSNERLK